MAIRYRVTLTPTERAHLETLAPAADRQSAVPQCAGPAVHGRDFQTAGGGSDGADARTRLHHLYPTV